MNEGSSRPIIAPPTTAGRNGAMLPSGGGAQAMSGTADCALRVETLLSPPPQAERQTASTISAAAVEPRLEDRGSTSSMLACMTASSNSLNAPAKSSDSHRTDADGILGYCGRVAIERIINMNEPLNETPGSPSFLDPLGGPDRCSPALGAVN